MGFADRLKELRKEKQLSQEQLSLELHVSRQAISKWETGVLPDIENLINIAHFFECSLDYLVGRDEQKINTKNVDWNERLKKVEKKSLIMVLVCIALMIILWITSKFIEVNFVRQDISGKWYTGFRAFVDQYRLYPLIFVLITLCLIFLNLRCVINVIRNKKNKKYIIFRVFSWIMYILMFCYWIIDFIDISKFFAINNETIIGLSIYILLVILSNLGMYCYERRE